MDNNTIDDPIINESDYKTIEGYVVNGNSGLRPAGFEGLNPDVQTMVLIPNDGDPPKHDTSGFTFLHFVNFLKHNKVFPMAIASILSDRINDLANTFVNYIIMPVINRDGDKDGERDIKQLEYRYITLFGIKFMIGKLFVAMLKFMIISYVVFLMTKIGSNMMDKLEKQATQK
jgi:large conductance mechanosensitive channel